MVNGTDFRMQNYSEMNSILTAIKYDPIFGDAFWNSSENGMASYIYLMMTSWAIVCDVWYLPPMTRMQNEDAVDFANRVKAEIARQGGLVDLMWYDLSFYNFYIQ